jgi:hypothetical protein
VAVAGRGGEELFFFSVSLGQIRSRWSSVLLTGSGSRALAVVLATGCSALEASASFGWSLDEVENCSFFYRFSC